MKTTDDDSHDRLLEQLFREIPLETPSSGFKERLSLRIEKEIRKKERKQKWIIAGQIAAGVFSILFSALGVLYWQSSFTFSFLESKLLFLEKGFSFDPLIWVIGLAVLLVLMGDSLLRKYSH